MSKTNPSKDATATQKDEPSPIDEATQDASTEMARRLSLAGASLAGQDVGPYRIIQELSVGGMGAVYRAEQTTPIRRMVALKVIKFDSVSEEWIKRFEAERQAMAVMDHPCIATILDGGELPGGAPYLAMELVNGLPFAAYCDSENLSVKQRLELFVQVCRAVQHAHSKGIIHRDLKPSNVLISISDGKPLPKVIDFGLAKSIDPECKLADTELTAHGGVMGTFSYMSPEQAAGEAVDGRTDIYSLGIMLYETLVGSTPVEPQSLAGIGMLQALELIREHVAQKPSVRLSQAGKTITTITEKRSTTSASLSSILTGELDWITMQAIEKDLGRRYRTAGEFADDIERYLNHEPVFARPPSVLYRFKKYTRRNRSKVALLGTLTTATLIIAALIPMIWRYQRETAITKLESQLLAEPAQFTLSTDEWQTQNAIIGQLGQYDEILAEAARADMVEIMTTALARAIDNPRPTAEDRKLYRDALNHLNASTNDKRLTTRLSEIEKHLATLSGGWLIIFDVSSSDPNRFVKLFDSGTVQTGSDGSVQTVRNSAAQGVSEAEQLVFANRHQEAAPLTATVLDCSGDMRVEVEFRHWRSAPEVGITLNAVDEEGYDFVIRPAATPVGADEARSGIAENETTAGLSSPFDGPLAHTIEIRRGNIPLLRTELAMNDLDEHKPLRVKAGREENNLTLELNGRKFFQILDPFPLRTSSEGRIGIRSFPSVSLVAFRCAAKNRTSAQAGLILGDQSFSQQDYDAALNAYDAQRSQASLNPTIRAEAEYKAAVCLQRLGRSEEAAELLGRLEVSQVVPWSTLAGLSIWEQTLGSDDFQTQNEAFKRMRATQNTANLTSLLPESARRRILDQQLKPMSMASLLRADPSRLDRVRFAAEIDKTLSYDGRGSLAGQLEYSRVLRFEGLFDDAIEILQDLNERFQHPHVTRLYARQLRLSGQTENAISVLTKAIDADPSRSDALALQRALCHFAWNRPELAEQDMETAVESSNNDVSVVAQALLVQGFLKLKDQDVDGAKASWRQGYFRSRELLGMVGDSNRTALIHLLVLGSLSGELRQEDSDAFLEMVLVDAQATSLKSVIQLILPPDRIHQVFGAMWRSDVGMKWAKSIAYENINLRDRTLGPVVVAAYQFLCEGAFAGEPNREEASITLNCVEEGVRLWLETGEIKPSQIAFFGMAWKGIGALPSELPPTFLAQFNFLLGSKRVQSKSIPAAKKLFQQSLQLAEVDSQVYKLAEKSLKLLEANRGVLAFDFDGEPPCSCEVRDASGSLMELTEEDTAERRLLQPGEYAVLCNERSWTGTVKIKLGRKIEISIPWKWSRSEAANRIKGMLSHPAQLPGIEDWQLLRSNLEGDCFDLAWSPDGEKIAIAGDGLLRIADAKSGEYISAHALTGESMRSVDWSSQNLISYGSTTGRVLIFDPQTQLLMETKQRFPTRVRRLRWNPAGDLLAVAGESGQVWFYDRNGDLFKTISGTSGNWLSNVQWSPNGQAIAIVGFSEAAVWNTQVWQQDFVFNGLKDGQGVLWAGDGSSLVVADNSRLLHFDVRGWDVIREQVFGAFPRVSSLGWGPDEKSVIGTGRGGGGFLVWDLDPKADVPLKKEFRYGHDPIRESPNGELVASGNPNGCLVYDRSITNEIVCIGNHPQQILKRVSYSRAGDQVAIVRKHDKDLAVLNFKSGQTLYLPRGNSYRSCAWNTAGTLLAVGREDGGVSIWDAQLNRLIERNISDAAILNLAWTHDDRKLVASADNGQLIEVSFEGKAINEVNISSSLLAVKTLGEKDDDGTSWEDSCLVLARNRDEGIHFRNGQLRHFSLDTESVDGSLQALHAMPNRNFCFLSDGSLLAGCFQNIASTAKGLDWQWELMPLGETPACVCELSQDLILAGTDEGAINQIDLTTGKMNRIFSGGNGLVALERVDDNTVLAIEWYGTLRKIDIRTGEVLQLAVVTGNESFACLTGGGKLQSPPGSLDGFSCIVRTAAGTSLRPALEFLNEAEEAKPIQE